MQWYRRSPEDFVGFLVIVAIGVLIYVFFQKHPISNQVRRWNGLVFMALFLAGAAFSGVHHALNLDLFGYVALVTILAIWVPITYSAKSVIMEIWMAVTIGLPLARYVVLALKHH